MHGDTRKILACTGHQLIPDPLCWKWRNTRGCLICHKTMDLGSVNAPPPLEHRQSGVGWSCIAPESKFSYCFRTGKAQATRKEFMIDDRARRRYYASRFSLFVSYGVNSTATMPGPASVRSLAKKRGPVYGQQLEAASRKLQARSLE